MLWKNIVVYENPLMQIISYRIIYVHVCIYVYIYIYVLIGAGGSLQHQMDYHEVSSKSSEFS